MTAAIFGIGAYAVAEAARLLHMQPTTLRRWLYGYDYLGGRGRQPPLWDPQYAGQDAGQLLGFRDLIEARVVNALRLARFGLPTIRLCIGRARALLGSGHPFSTTAFRTDGRKLFLDITKAVDEPTPVDLKARQQVFRDLVLPSLQGLEFGDVAATRWWLLDGRRTIVADPERSFGQPIVAQGGVLTARILQDVAAEGSADRVARLYELPVDTVRDAVAFERRLGHRLAA